MRVYFDTCCLQRPLDDKSQLRVALEAEAVLGLLTECESGRCSLVGSEVLALENSRNPHPQRQAFVAGILDVAAVTIAVNADVEKRATELEARGFPAFDALHIACAEVEQVDYFCTCDDRLLNKSKRQSDLSITVLSPLDLAKIVLP